MSEEATKKSDGGAMEIIRVVIHALILALIVRTLLYQPFNIPSGSMKSTLLVGDYLFVSKFSYGYSNYSIPFGPQLFNGRIWSSQPERGDVAVFKLPRDNETDYIKRIVGLPGDRIQMIGGILHINGEPVKKERLDDYVEMDEFGNVSRIKQYRETLPNGVSHITLDLFENGYADTTKEFTVPPDHYFVMGDNRDNSTDSRVLNQVGFVPFENLVGRAEIIFFSIDEGSRFLEFWKWPTSIRWGRLFSGVD